MPGIELTAAGRAAEAARKAGQAVSYYPKGTAYVGPSAARTAISQALRTVATEVAEIAIADVAMIAIPAALMVGVLYVAINNGWYSDPAYYGISRDPNYDAPSGVGVHHENQASSKINMACFNMGSAVCLTVIKLVNDKNQTLKDVWIIYGANKEATAQDSIVNVFEPDTSYVDALYAMTSWIGEGGLAEDGLTFNFISISPLPQSTAIVPVSNDQHNQPATLPTPEDKTLIKVNGNIYVDSYDSYRQLQNRLPGHIQSNQKTIEIDKNLSSTKGLDIRCFRASSDGPLFVKVSHGQLSALIIPNFNFNTLTSLKKIPQQQAIKTTLLINQNINSEGNPQQQIVYHLHPSYIFINGGYFDQKNNQESMSYITDYFAWKTDSKGWINPEKDILHFMSYRDDSVIEDYIKNFNQKLESSDTLKAGIEVALESAYNKKDVEQILGFYTYNSNIYDLRLTNLPVYSTYTQSTTIFSWQNDSVKPTIDAYDYFFENTQGLLQQNAQASFDVTTLEPDIKTREEKTISFLATINDSLTLFLNNKTSTIVDYWGCLTVLESMQAFFGRFDIQRYILNGQYYIEEAKKLWIKFDIFLRKIQKIQRDLEGLYNSLPKELQEELDKMTNDFMDYLDQCFKEFNKFPGNGIMIGTDKPDKNVYDDNTSKKDNDPDDSSHNDGGNIRDIIPALSSMSIDVEYKDKQEKIIIAAAAVGAMFLTTPIYKTSNHIGIFLFAAVVLYTMNRQSDTEAPGSASLLKPTATSLTQIVNDQESPFTFSEVESLAEALNDDIIDDVVQIVEELYPDSIALFYASAVTFLARETDLITNALKIRTFTKCVQSYADTIGRSTQEILNEILETPTLKKTIQKRPKLPTVNVGKKSAAQIQAIINKTKNLILKQSWQDELNKLTASLATTASTNQTTYTSHIEVAFFNVGQGACTLAKMITKEEEKDNTGKVIKQEEYTEPEIWLIDAGSTQSAYNVFDSKKIEDATIISSVISWLENVKLAANKKATFNMILSHSDEDHHSFMPAIIKKTPDFFEKIKLYFGTLEDKIFEKLQDLGDKIEESAKVRGITIEVEPIYGPELFSFENVNKDVIKVNLLNAGIAGHTTDPNAHSIITKISYGEISVLLPGDATKATYEHIDYADLKSTIFEVSHHGADTSDSTNEKLLEEVDPQYDIISSAFFSKHYHPQYKPMKILLKYWKDHTNDIGVQPEHFIYYNRKKADSILDFNKNKFSLKISKEGTYVNDTDRKLDVGMTNLPLYETAAQGTLIFTWKKDDKTPNINYYEYDNSSLEVSTTSQTTANLHLFYKKDDLKVDTWS